MGEPQATAYLSLVFIGIAGGICAGSLAVVGLVMLGNYRRRRL